MANKRPTDDVSQANETTPIIETKQSTNLSMPINPTSVLKYEYGVIDSSTASHIQSNVSTLLESSPLSSEIELQTQTQTITELVSEQSAHNSASMNSFNQSDTHRAKRSVSSITTSPVASTTVHIHSSPIQQSSNVKSQSNISNTNNSKSNNLQMAIGNGNGNGNDKTSINKLSKGAKKKERNDAIIGHISVLIHNISVISNADKDYPDNSEKEWINPMQGCVLFSI